MGSEKIRVLASERDGKGVFWKPWFKEQNAFYVEDHMKHTSTRCGQNAELQQVKVCGAYRTTGIRTTWICVGWRALVMTAKNPCLS
jgi:hypothetical protein